MAGAGGAAGALDVRDKPPCDQRPWWAKQLLIPRRARYGYHESTLEAQLYYMYHRMHEVLASKLKSRHANFINWDILA
jgi:hypothetical protein